MRTAATSRTKYWRPLLGGQHDVPDILGCDGPAASEQCELLRGVLNVPAAEIGIVLLHPRGDIVQRHPYCWSTAGSATI